MAKTKKITTAKKSAEAPKATPVARPRNLDPTVQNVHGDDFYTSDRTQDAVDAVTGTDDVLDKDFQMGLRRLEGRIFDADYKASVQFRRAACGHHVLSKCDPKDVQAYGNLLVSVFTEKGR